MSKIYEVRSTARGDGKLYTWGAFYSRNEAQKRLAEQSTGKNRKWADKRHGDWWIEEIDTTGLFQLPSRPQPRELYSTRTQVVESTDGTLNTLHVDVCDDSGSVIASYDRNHPNMYRTFEPFRQGDRVLALIAPDYTATTVIDLATGEIVASEEPDTDGFCPVGFYVPDWWDVNDSSILPGSSDWHEGCEHPDGTFGFVWGCYWGDDSSWKVQHLDLSDVLDGKIRRDERYGYVELAAHPTAPASEFVDCWFHERKRFVTFSTLQRFNVDSGTLLDPLDY